MGKVPSTYEIYLESEEWRQKRIKVFERDNYKCVHCGSTSNLSVHHLTYANLYHEELHDLVTVCDACHSAFHDLAKRAEYCTATYYLPEPVDFKAEYEKEKKERAEANAEIVQRFKNECLQLDYCKNGPLDLTDFSTMNKVLEKLRKETSLEYLSVNKKDLQRWVICRRMEFFERCLEKGLSLEKMINATKFSESYLAKNYQIKTIKQYLDEEKAIKEITE